MSSIYYLFIALPLFFLVLLSFVFSSSVKNIIQQQTVMNCPFPVNSAIATLDLVQSPPQITYSVVLDNDTSAYHVTVFECHVDNLSSGASINTRVYTGSNNWYDVTGRASGYLFYISESLDTAWLRTITFGNMLWSLITAPSSVTGMAWFAYVQLLLVGFIAMGIFMIVRGAG